MQSVGFNLDEIKKLLENPNKQMIQKKERLIKEETKGKIKTLKEVEGNMKERKFKPVGNVEFIKYPKHYEASISKIIKDKSKAKKILQQLDKQLDKVECIYYKDKYIFSNNEPGYKEKDIDCGIARIIENDDNPNIRKYLKKKNITIYYDDKASTCIHAKVEKDILSTYQDIITFANLNDIQIRGSFQEYYKGTDVEVYIEAYDLLEDNQEEIEYNNSKVKRLENKKVDKNYVGKWEIVTKIFGNNRKFNSLKKYEKPDTDFDIIIINSDGTTNIENTVVKDDYLITKCDGFVKINHLYIKKNKKYMSALISPFRPNARPYEYIYKKIK